MKKLKTVLVSILITLSCQLNAQDSTFVKTTTQVINSVPVRMVITFQQGDRAVQIQVESLAKQWFASKNLKDLIFLFEPISGSDKKDIVDLLENFVKINMEIIVVYNSVVGLIDPIFSQLKNDVKMKNDVINYEKIKANNKPFLKLFSDDLAWGIKKLNEYK